MPRVIVIAEVKDVQHWLNSPKREEVFGPLGWTEIKPGRPHDEHSGPGRGEGAGANARGGRPNGVRRRHSRDGGELRRVVGEDRRALARTADEQSEPRWLIAAQPALVRDPRDLKAVARRASSKAQWPQNTDARGRGQGSRRGSAILNGHLQMWPAKPALRRTTGAPNGTADGESVAGVEPDSIPESVAPARKDAPAPDASEVEEP